MSRWRLHLAVLAVLFILAGLVALADLSGGAFLRGLFAWVALGWFATYAAGTSGVVAIFRLAPRGVAILHGALIVTALVVAGIEIGKIRANRPPTTIEGRKLVLERWWLHTTYDPAGTVYAEVEADFDGTLNLRRFSATSAGQPVLQQHSEGQRYLPVTRGQRVLLQLGYSRIGEGSPDNFVLSFQLHSQLTGREESVDYATDFESRKSTDFWTNRRMPPLSVDPQARAVPTVPPVAPPLAVASLGKPEFDGSDLEREKLQSYVAARRGGLLNCYEKEQRRSAIGAGTVSVRFKITPVGRASGVEVEENTLGSEAVASCIRVTLRGWVFPFKPEAEVSVLYPFHFEPALD